MPVINAIGLYNLSATSAPTVNDDSGDGYRVGSIWIDTTADKSYICVDATAGAAAWIEMGGGGASGTPVDGWNYAEDAMTYASNSDPSFTLTISGDKTAKYFPGISRSPSIFDLFGIRPIFKRNL